MYQKIQRKFFVFLTILSVLTLQAQPRLDSVDAFISRQVKEQKLIGLSVGIIEKGKLLGTWGYGMANLEQHVRISDLTVFKLASVSKHMIAVGILQLVQAGKISLDDSCTRYFPDAPDTWKPITIRHLLNHTSGLVRESPAFNPSKIQPDSLLIRAAFGQPLIFATGTSWQYCNLGYFMLADIIRIVTGRPFIEHMKEEIFKPNELFYTASTSVATIIPYRAGGYIRVNDSLIHNAEDYLALRPSGAFISNMDNMLQWELLLQQNKLLSAGLTRQMWTDTVPNPQKLLGNISQSYGYGFYRSLYNGHTVVYHGGSLPGFRTLFFRLPEENSAIILLANSEPVNLMPIAIGIIDRLGKN